ncbi:MAG: hypothetical protein QM741_10690 [Rudaea sp.]
MTWTWINARSRYGPHDRDMIASTPSASFDAELIARYDVPGPR